MNYVINYMNLICGQIVYCDYFIIILYMDNCVLAFSLVGGFLTTMFKSKNKDTSNKLQDLLDENQKSIYEKTRKERQNIYVYSWIISIVICAVYVYYNKVDNCTFLFALNLLSVILYLIWPKCHSLKPSLVTLEQKELYRQVGDEMKMSYMYGLLVGGLSYYIFRNFI